MSQRKYNENLGSNGSILEIRDSTIDTNGTSEERKTEAFKEEKVLEEKSLTERWKTHRFWPVRGIYYLLLSVWTVVMVIGGLIAWLISLLFI